MFALGVEYSLRLVSGATQQYMFNEWPEAKKSAQARGNEAEEAELASADAGLGFKISTSPVRSRNKSRACGRKKARSLSKREREQVNEHDPTQLIPSSDSSSDEDDAVISAEQASLFPKELPPWFGDSLRVQATQNKKQFEKIIKNNLNTHEQAELANC